MFILGAFASIGRNVKIGNGAKIFPQVFIGDNVTIGKIAFYMPGLKFTTIA
jgi:UDP-3-O-[3-hydroxymyristoyl] glucosamine N-acyltransferase